MQYNYLEIAKEILFKNIDKNQFNIFLFGSRADGTFREMSDIDIGILGRTRLDSKIKSDLEEALLESIIPYKVDVIDFSSVSENFKNHAMKNVIYWNKVIAA